VAAAVAAASPEAPGAAESNDTQKRGVDAWMREGRWTCTNSASALHRLSQRALARDAADGLLQGTSITTSSLQKIGSSVPLVVKFRRKKVVKSCDFKRAGSGADCQRSPTHTIWSSSSAKARVCWLLVETPEGLKGFAESVIEPV